MEKEARIPVYLNDEQARTALKNLTAEADRWRQKMHDALVAGDTKGLKQAETELKKVNKQASDLKKSTFDVNSVLNNISSASINDLRKAMTLLRKEQAGLNRDSKEYAEVSKKISAVKGEFNKINGAVKEQGGYLTNLIGNAKNLLPAFGFGAIAVAAQQAFQKVVASTDTLSTQWAIFMGGMKGATDEFFRTIATGDWSNFIDNMQEAIRVGREYEAMLDNIEAKQRAVSIAEADAKDEIVKLEEDLRNKGLTGEQRIAAGRRRIQIEEELAKKRASVAKDAYENELMMAEQASRLSKERLMQIAADFDSEIKIKAEAYNTLQSQLRTLEARQAQGGASTGVLFPGMQSNAGFSDAINKVKAQMATFPADVVQYAGSLALLGNVTDEQMNKVVAAYSAMKDAEVSGRESIKRVITMVNNLQAGEGKAGAKSGETLADKARRFAIPEQEAPLKVSDFSGQAIRLGEEEAQRLAEKKASEEEWTKFVENQAKERMRIAEEENQKLQQDLEFQKQYNEAKQQLAAETIGAVGQVAGVLAAMFKEGSAAQIAALAVEKAAAIAQVIYNTAVANAKAVAAFPITSGQPWVGINTANAAASIATIVGTTITSFKDKKNNDKPGFATGGFTGYGADDQVAGFVHKNEFVVNANAMRNPYIREKVNMIDTAQRTGRIANTAAVPATSTADPELKALLAANAKAITDFMKWKPKVYTEMIKKDLDTLDEIDNKR